MNILLFAPGLLMLLLEAQGLAGAAICLSICAGIQVENPSDAKISVGMRCDFCVSDVIPTLEGRSPLLVVVCCLIFAILFLHTMRYPMFPGDLPLADELTVLLNEPARLACVSQLLLGAPFLAQHPVAYLARSFDLGRVFKYEWTVNFKFLSEEAFVSPMLSAALLALTVTTLAIFAVKWIRSVPRVGAPADGRVTRGDGVGTNSLAGFPCLRGGRQLLPEYVVKTLFVSNFIGIVFCRSLHYQVKCGGVCGYMFVSHTLVWHALLCRCILLQVSA